MSLETCKKEYYPVDADKVPKKDAALHSLMKWRGLQELDQHGCQVVFYGGRICDAEDDYLDINSETCALCVHYMQVDDYPSECESCPIFGVTGDKCSKRGAWGQWVNNRDPGPMIEILRSIVGNEHSIPSTTSD